jgi:histidyl-tRNA synthetase
MPRQLKYADRQGIPVVAILGPQELESSSVTLKHLPTGRQISSPLPEAAAQVRALCGLA